MKKASEIVLSEKVIERQILDWLKLKGILSFKVQNGGVFDQKRGAFRFNSATRTKGIPDIIGVFKGRPLAIEVKSKKGRLSPDQETFLESWLNNGGIAVVARSVQDVEDALRVAA